MEQRKHRSAALALLLIAAAAGLALRRWQLADAFDAAGLVLSGRPSTWALGVLSAVTAAAAAFLARGLEPRSVYTDTFSSGRGELVVSLIAAALLLAGTALDAAGGAGGAAMAVSFLGVASALCMAATAVLRSRGVVPSLALHLLPCIYLIVKLIVDFKQWSVDPAVLDYCYDLFASIAAMCAVFHLGGFCFDRGQRRMSAFWCLVCPFFAAVSLADGGLVHCLTAAGIGLWTGVNGWQLLED